MTILWLTLWIKLCREIINWQFCAVCWQLCYICRGIPYNFKVCTKPMPPEAYTTLLNFFTHTMNICYFLSVQVWQENVEYLLLFISPSLARKYGQNNISDFPLCKEDVDSWNDQLPCYQKHILHFLISSHTPWILTTSYQPKFGKKIRTKEYPICPCVRTTKKWV